MKEEEAYSILDIISESEGQSVILTRSGSICVPFELRQPECYSLSPEDIDERDREILQRFYKCELFGQIIDWLNCDMRYDIQSQFSRLCEIQDSITASAIQKCISK